ncbi:MAG: hypothetical protein KAQ98_01230, partial [Bacteriovoracaceae bacterium]|nr:hypothetical protein [Bacteriovoracaceae bacterium]
MHMCVFLKKNFLFFILLILNLFLVTSCLKKPLEITNPALLTNPPIEIIFVNSPNEIILVDPASSPGNDTTLEVQITGVDSGNTIGLYSDINCTATEIQNGVASSATINLTTPVLSEGSYTFYAKSTDPKGNQSDCSVANVTYELDLTAPDAPGGLNLIDPASSPGNDITLEVQVTGVVFGDTVELYSDGTCSTLVQSGEAFGVAVNLTTPVLSEGSHTFYAKSTDPVGNTSLCSLAYVSYELDLTDPPVPSGLSLFDPTSSPANDTTPEIQITGVVSGNTISLYSDVNCTATMQSGVASGATINLTTSELVDGDYTFYAKAVEPSGNSSTCSSANVMYTLNTTLPSAPSGLSLVDPASSPGNDTTLEVQITGVVSGNTIDMYSDINCTATVQSGVASSATINLTTPVLTEGSYTFYAKSTDPASNSSACSAASVFYELDLTDPPVPSGLSLVDPASSPGNDTTPEIQISGVESGDTISLYSNISCTATVQSGVASGTTINLITPVLAENSYTFYAKSTDPASNQSSCSAVSVFYELDLTGPAAPSGLSLI